MACKAEDLRQIPLFALLDDDEMAVLAAQVEIQKFAARQRIYKIDEPGKHAYVMMSGVVRVSVWCWRNRSRRRIGGRCSWRIGWMAIPDVKPICGFPLRDRRRSKMGALSSVRQSVLFFSFLIWLMKAGRHAQYLKINMR